MTSSRLEPPTHTTGAHRARRRAPHSSTQPAPQHPSVHDEPHLDGLFTYCLSVLCDHDAATEALGGVLAIAERQGGRCPAGAEERKSWLYALARWMCLRKLAERKQGYRAHRHGAKPSARQSVARGVRAARRTPPAPVATSPAPFAPGGASSGRAYALASDPAAASETVSVPVPDPDPDPVPGAVAEAHRRELAQLAWPEAAGTTPEQREALELAVRHRLAPRAVASVLGLEPAAARELLAAAACEVERTRAALAVVESGNCPTMARLTGGHRVLLSATLRRELVRHVDDCPRCRRAAERVGARGPWPGAAVTPGAALPVVPAPRPSAYVAMAHARRSRSGGPRFDRAGFPMHPKDRAARRDRMRARVVTTTVVATVVAAPVIALWTAYRGAPQTGEGHEGSSVAATGTDLRRLDDPRGHYENAGNVRPRAGHRPGTGRAPEVSAEVISPGPVPAGADGLTVEARSSDSTTLLRLTATGGVPVTWSARADVSWLRLSRSSGMLAAGESVTVRVRVIHLREPHGHWSARITLAPSGSVVAVRGNGRTGARPGHAGGSVPYDPSEPPHRPPSSPRPTRTTDPTSAPADPAPSPTQPSPTDPAQSPDPTTPPPPTGAGTPARTD
ncbi:hypothetical protein [Streptomyces sp. NPDC056061]|uniref:hypothetical protein n=1 Tax=Streptomyces sp. NPDC056061 TaxID=3345700 RepID=UPI0035DD25F0